MRRKDLTFYVIRRLLAFVALLLGLSFLVFSLLYVAPGSVISILLGTSPRTPASVQALTAQYHLDDPFLVQYWLWLKDAVRLDFGTSISTSIPVVDAIKSRLPISLFLGGYAFVLTVVFGLGLGVLAGMKRETWIDRGVVASSIVALSTPVFVSGVVALYVFAIVLHWFPAFGTGTGFVDRLWHMTLPAVTLSSIIIAYVVKHTRSAMMNVLDQDYVTFARARGMSASRVLAVYAFRNALIPIVTIIGLVLGFVITGAIIIEVTFSLPGIGSLLVQAATTKDLPLIQGLAIVTATVIMGANLLADLLYMAVDPRMRLGRRAL